MSDREALTKRMGHVTRSSIEQWVYTINALERMGITVHEGPCTSAADIDRERAGSLDGLREALQLVFRRRPDDSHGESHFNHGITVALRLLNKQAGVDMTTACERVSPPNMGGGFCGSHHGWLGQTAKWCDLAEQPWAWAALRDEGETT